MKEITILCHNDYPHSAYEDEAEAIRICEELNEKEKKCEVQTILWHLRQTILKEVGDK